MKYLRKKHLIRKYKKEGVIFTNEENIFIDESVKIGKNVLIGLNVTLLGDTEIGDNCEILNNSYIENSKIEKNTKIESSYIRDSEVGKGTTIGPFANIKQHSKIGSFCRIGNYVEIKNSTLGNGTKCAHLSYVGDADVGERVNVGCGVVFANYDGKKKHHSTVGNDVFIGCNCNLIAPIIIKDGCFIAAGTTVTQDLLENRFCISRAPIEIKERF